VRPFSGPGGRLDTVTRGLLRRAPGYTPAAFQAARSVTAGMFVVPAPYENNPPSSVRSDTPGAIVVPVLTDPGACGGTNAEDMRTTLNPPCRRAPLHLLLHPSAALG
jgi:hypothetical protein